MNAADFVMAIGQSSFICLAIACGRFAHYVPYTDIHTPQRSHDSISNDADESSLPICYSFSYSSLISQWFAFFDARDRPNTKVGDENIFRGKNDV